MALVIENSPPLAIVIWWNNKEFCVKCPVCEENHIHRPNNGATIEDVIHYIVRYCDSRCKIAGLGGRFEYHAYFSFEDEKGRYSVVIDKKAGRYVTVGVPGFNDDGGDNPRPKPKQLAKSLRTLQISEETGMDESPVGFEYPVFAEDQTDLVLQQKFFDCAQKMIRGGSPAFAICMSWIPRQCGIRRGTMVSCLLRSQARWTLFDGFMIEAVILMAPIMRVKPL